MKVFKRLYSLPQRPILWMACGLHFAWGIALVLIPGKVKMTTGLAPFSDTPEVYGLLFIASSVLALLAIVREAEGRGVTAWTFWMFMPQQTLLMVSAGSVLFNAISGHFADGTVVPNATWFILADQLPKLALAILHPFGVLRMHLSILPESKVGHIGGRGGAGGQGGTGGPGALGEPGEPGQPGEPGEEGR